MRFCIDLCLAVVLIQIAWTDIRTMMIPDRVLVPLMILAGLSVFTEPEIPFTARLIGIFCTALPMYLANLFVDGAFGGGDIRLLAAAGFCLGWKTCLIGTITGTFSWRTSVSGPAGTWKGEIRRAGEDPVCSGALYGTICRKTF